MAKKPLDLDGFGVTTGDQPEHYAAIGRLITAFGKVEICIHDAVFKLLGINVRAGRLVSGAQRYSDNVRLVRDLAKMCDLLHSDVLNRGLDHGNRLKLIRDIIAHRTWAFREREMAFSSFWTSRTMSNEDVEVYSIEYLNTVADHANTIALMLIHPFSGEEHIRFTSETLPGYRESYEKRLLLPFPGP